MDSRKYVLKQTAIVALGQVLCVGAMIGIFALVGQLNRSVVVGGIVGGVLAVLNFFAMAVGAMIAADKAMEQDVKGGKAMVRTSMLLRMAVIAIVMIAFAKSGFCDVLSLVLPLAFTRPILVLSAFFGKAGELGK